MAQQLSTPLLSSSSGKNNKSPMLGGLGGIAQHIDVSGVGFFKGSPGTSLKDRAEQARILEMATKAMENPSKTVS